jgi:hypothetical protein
MSKSRQSWYPFQNRREGFASTAGTTRASDYFFAFPLTPDAALELRDRIEVWVNEGGAEGAATDSERSASSRMQSE